MDQIMNYNKEDVTGEVRKTLDHFKSDGVSFSNYGEIKEDAYSKGKAVAGLTSNQVSNNKDEMTLKSCRQRQMSSDIFGVGMDRAWGNQPEPETEQPKPEPVVEAAEESAPLDLTQSDNNSEINDDVDAAAVSTPESTESKIDESAVVVEAAVQGLEKEAPKTGKRHFEGKNEVTKFW